MKRIYNLFLKYWHQYYEIITYLIFGGITTVVNIATYGLLSQVGLSTGVANAIAWVVSVLVAYITNRIWVFRSHKTGLAALKEFWSFIVCRVGTGLLDEAIMIVGVDVLGPQIVAPAHLDAWGWGMKIFANLLVIILNYVFSKLIIFKNRRDGKQA